MLPLLVRKGKAKVCADNEGFESVAAPVVPEPHFHPFEQGLVFGKRQTQAPDPKQRGIAQPDACLVAAET